MNDEINRKHWARRFEFWLIVAACIVASVLLGLAGCAPVPEPEIPPAIPEPSNVLRSFTIPSGSRRIDITEFRDSAGRVCVLARNRHELALDCGTPLPPPLDYERLPDPEITPFPERRAR